MKPVRLMPAAVLLLTAMALHAQDKPTLSASQATTITATVTAIDHETRKVTLERSDGEIVTLTASDEVRNLDQVGVGDTVYAEYAESLSIQVVADDAIEPGTETQSSTVRTPEGRMPGVAKVDSTVITATVEAIDLDTNTFRLREADGEIREYTARNPQNLRLASVGDKVVITVTESLVVTVSRKLPD